MTDEQRPAERTSYTITTGDGWSACPCNMHRAVPACGISPWYRVLVTETSFIVCGLSIEVGG